MGRGSGAAIREPGYLAARAVNGGSADPPYFRGARAHRKEARVFAVLAFSLSISASSLAGSPVSGTVVDSSGHAVPRATVQVVESDGTIAASIFTDVDGAFRAQWLEGMHFPLTVAAPRGLHTHFA